ncbi:MAG: hypothetical protein AB1555_15170 [Nitrospirota bacterium]
MKPVFNPAAGSGVLLCALSLTLFGCSSVSPTKASLRCGSSPKIRVTAAKPTVSVSYTEPTTALDGRPLTSLAKTTIYVDTGDGPVTAKDIPATSPRGGGHISQTITIPLKQQETVASICVTATDRQGNEGPPTHQ